MVIQIFTDEPKLIIILTAVCQNLEEIHPFLSFLFLEKYNQLRNRISCLCNTFFDSKILKICLHSQITDESVFK